MKKLMALLFALTVVTATKAQFRNLFKNTEGRIGVIYAPVQMSKDGQLCVTLLNTAGKPMVKNNFPVINYAVVNDSAIYNYIAEHTEDTNQIVVFGSRINQTTMLISWVGTYEEFFKRKAPKDFWGHPKDSAVGNTYITNNYYNNEKPRPLGYYRRFYNNYNYGYGYVRPVRYNYGYYAPVKKVCKKPTTTVYHRHR